MNQQRRPVPAARPVFSEDDRSTIAKMIDEALVSGALTLGPCTERFEEAFKVRHSVPHAVAVSSGTAALEIIFRALDVGGREVVVPTNTFFATAGAVQHAGGIPRLADVAPDTLALSTESVEASITDRTVGVVLVHIGGVVTPEVKSIRDLCDRRGLWLVEDAAHAHGADLDGSPAGTFGIAAAFSFYPTKVITSAEGGMIVTVDQRIADEARIYRDQGKAGFLGGDHVRMGYAWRLSEPQAAIGLTQLARLDEFISNRRDIARFYDTHVASVPRITPQPIPPGSASNYYKYVAMLDPAVDRQALKTRLRAEHAVSLSGEVYAMPLHRQPVFAELAIREFPVADQVCARQVCLPVHSDMTVEEAESVVSGLRSVLSDDDVLTGS